MKYFTILTMVVVLMCTTSSCSSDGNGDDDAGADAATDTDSDADLPWLEPDDIDFEEVDPPMSGSFIYWGEWGNTCDTLHMITPDGLTAGVRFTLNRLWSFGVAGDGVTIAFSSVDPYQEENWDLTIGDAVQYTWLLEGGEAPVQITSGSINDECHNFAPGDETLFLCRRANFFQEIVDDTLNFGSDPYRIMTHVLDGAEEFWLTPLEAGISDIGPVLLGDGSILFWRQEPSGSSFMQSLMRMEEDGSNVEYILQSATGPTVSPDETLVAYRLSWSSLVVADQADLTGGETILESTTGNLTDLSFSPDSTRIALLQGREDDTCSDLWVVDVDGSNATMLVDCVDDGVFPNGLQWVQAD